MAWTEDVKGEFFRDEDGAAEWIVNGVAVQGRFNDSFADDFGIEGTAPQLLIADTDLAACGAQADHAVSGPDGTFTVRGIHRHGSQVKMTTLILEDT